MNRLNELTPKEKLVYLAGLLEGEGCFYQHSNKRPSPHGGLQMGIVLEMSDRDVIVWAKENFNGGKVGLHEYPTHPDWSTTYRVSWCGKKSKDLAEAVYPYMGDRRRAKIAELLELDMAA